MLNVIKTETNTGRVIWEKTLADNWWGTYHDICIFKWCKQPEYFDGEGNKVPYYKPSKKMVCVDRQRNRTVTLTRI